MSVGKKKKVCSFETAMCVTYCCGTGGLSSFVRTAPLFCFAALPPDLLLSCLIVKMFVLTIWHPLPRYYWNTVYERVSRMVVYLVMPTVLHLPPTDPDALVGSTAPFRFRVTYKATNTDEHVQTAFNFFISCEVSYFAMYFSYSSLQILCLSAVSSQNINCYNVYPGCRGTCT